LVNGVYKVTPLAAKTQYPLWENIPENRNKNKRKHFVKDDIIDPPYILKICGKFKIGVEIVKWLNACTNGKISS